MFHPGQKAPGHFPGNAEGYFPAYHSITVVTVEPMLRFCCACFGYALSSTFFVVLKHKHNVPNSRPRSQCIIFTNSSCLLSLRGAHSIADLRRMRLQRYCVSGTTVLAKKVVEKLPCMQIVVSFPLAFSFTLRRYPN